MDTLPFNNLDKHLARFNATKKSKPAALITTGNGFRQYTFKKILTLHSTTTFGVLVPSVEEHSNENEIKHLENDKVHTKLKTLSVFKEKKQDSIRNFLSQKENLPVGCINNKVKDQHMQVTSQNKYNGSCGEKFSCSFIDADVSPKFSKPLPIVTSDSQSQLIEQHDDLIIDCTDGRNRSFNTSTVFPQTNYGKDCSKLSREKSLDSAVLSGKFDEFLSMPASPEQLNVTVMTKICSVLEKCPDVLKNNKILNSLIHLRQTILMRFGVADKMSSKNCFSTSSIHNDSTNNQKDRNCYDSISPVRLHEGSPYQKLKSTAIFSSDLRTCSSVEEASDKNGPEQMNYISEPLDVLNAEDTILNQNIDGVTGRPGKFYGNHRDDGMSEKFKGYKFSHSTEMLSVFKNVFGLQKFRYNQLEAINAALLQEDCFILMPTGGGKSLCYQLPALLSAGVTIVVSPLRSLIMDQVQKLWSLDVPANSLSGDLNTAAANAIYKQLFTCPPGIKLLYVTPEKISASDKLKSTLESLYSRKMLARFVIDEAHCISEWGHDFRPDYKRLKILREKFPGVPLIALTATATPRVRLDILQQLNMLSPKWFLQSFNRPNLKYEVRPKKGKSVVQDIVELIKSQFENKCGIIYCLSRNDCDSIAAYLSKSGIRAMSYHAGLDNRNQVQEMWFSDKFKIVCATIAFGMGIDKPDVRFVIHHCMSKSVESYYQESGRAGRDGEPSSCILYYTYQDVTRIKRIIQQDEQNKKMWTTHFNNLYKMVHYCENKSDCRRVQLLDYFGEVFDKKLCAKDPRAVCDNCLSKDVYQHCDVTEDAKAIVQCLSDLIQMKKRKNYTLTYLTDIFKGAKTQKIMYAGHNNLPLHGRGSNYSRSDAERLLRKLVLEQFLQENLIFNHLDLPMSYVFIGRRANELLDGKVKITFAVKKGTKQSNSNQVVVEVQDKDMEQLAERCYNELIEVSKALAAERHVHYANIINVEALRQMSREMPMAEEEMLDVPHVTRAIFDKYGAKFLEVTQKYGAERCVILAERADKNEFMMCLDDDDENWSETTSHSTVRPFKKNFKRKNTSKGPPAKRKGNFSYGKNFKKYSKKSKDSNFRRTKGFMSNKNEKFGFKSSKVGLSSNNSRTPGFLPMP